MEGENAVKPPKTLSKGVIALIVAVAVLGSAVTTLLAVMFTSRDTVPKGYVPEGYISIEDAQALLASMTLPAGSMSMDFQELTDSEADQIISGSDELWEVYERNPLGDTVDERDWDRYSSGIATEWMNSAEKTLYERYDACCRTYLETGVDGYRGGKSGDYFYYGTGVAYRDLGLTKEQAQSLFYWFKFNNPQYYFLCNSAAYSDTSMFPELYERFADGAERTKTTNELFTKLDGWIESISDDEVTHWQMELAANDLLCRKLEYDEEEPFFQSMYSAVLLERTVCAGYSETFCAMMNAVGVDAMVALNDIHAWNVVKWDDGSYYVVDVLWNENRQDNNSPKRTYFNVGEASAKAGDTGKAEHSYGADVAAWAPDLAQSNYVPSEYDLTGSNGTADRLAAPQNLRAPDEGDDEQISVAWDPVDGAAQYTVELYSSDQKTLLLSKSFEKTAISIKFGSYSSLAVRVRAENGERFSDWSEFLAVNTKAEAAQPTTSGTTLAAPQNITITKDEPTITRFSWDPVEGAEQYQIILFKDAEHTETWLSGFQAKTSMGYQKLQPGKTYYYGVRAMKTVDGKDYYSDWTFFKHTTPKEDASGAALSAPQNVTITNDEPTRTGFSWDPVEGADQYELARFTDADHKEIAASGPVEKTNSGFKGLKPGKTYYYGVRAMKTVDGKDYYSDWTYFKHTTPKEDAQPTLAAPQNITITKDEPTVFHFSWDPVEGAEQYEVIMYEDAERTEILLSGFRDQPTKGYESMTPGKTYYYGIRAMKTVDGEDLYSDWTYFKHTNPKEDAQPALAAPQNIAIIKDEPTITHFSWDPVEGAEQYEVALYKDSTLTETLHSSFRTDTTMGYKDLQPNTTYYYGIRAVKTVDGEDLYSDWAYFKHLTPKESS